MKYLKETQTEFIDKILGMIILEKGLSQNTIISYKKDIILVFNWFKKNNIDFLKASELNIIEFFASLFCSLTVTVIPIILISILMYNFFTSLTYFIKE